MEHPLGHLEVLDSKPRFQQIPETEMLNWQTVDTDQRWQQEAGKDPAQQLRGLATHTDYLTLSLSSPKGGHSSC